MPARQGKLSAGAGEGGIGSAGIYRVLNPISCLIPDQCRLAPETELAQHYVYLLQLLGPQSKETNVSLTCGELEQPMQCSSYWHFCITAWEFS